MPGAWDFPGDFLQLAKEIQRHALKKILKPCEKKERAEHLIREYHVSIGRACKVVELARSMFYYKHQKDDTEVISKLETMVKQLPNRGFDEYFGRMRNEGYKWNHKRVRRVYRLMKLHIRRRHKRRVPTRVKEPLTVPQGLNYCWSADFMSDALVYGRKVRILNVMDDYKPRGSGRRS